MTDKAPGTVDDLQTVPRSVPKRTGHPPKSRKCWTISVRFAGTVPARPSVPASPYVVGDAVRSGSQSGPKRCKYAALLADLDPEQAAELDRRLTRGGGEYEVVRVLTLAGLTISAATPYRHKRGRCQCQPAEGTPS